VRQGWRGEIPGEQRGDRDAELGAGELEGELPQGAPDGPCSTVSLVTLALDLGTIDGDEGKLSGDEKRVEDGQEQEREQR
jgi:hypothetical protein